MERALRADLLAGAVVAAMLVPQAMAYAMLAGLPPHVGLYGALLPPAIYGLLGSSRVLAVGPVAVVSLLVAEAVAGAPTPAAAIERAAALALIVGAVHLALAALRLGALTDLLGHPVLVGFTAAAALTIGVGQLPALLGLQGVGRGALVERVTAIGGALGSTHAATAAVGAACVVALLLARGAARLGAGPAIRRAAPLLVVIGATLAASALRLDRAGVTVLGAVPAGLPAPRLPLGALDAELWLELTPAAVVIALVGFVESMSIAGALARRRRERLDPDRDLLALGLANLAGGLTGAYPTTGGLSRTVVNDEAGARSGRASLCSAALVGLTLVWLTPLIALLPRAALAAIVLVAVSGLIDLPAIRHVWLAGRAESAAMLTTFAICLALGLELGVAAGCLLALAYQLARSRRPHLAVVGRIAGTEHFRNERRHAVERDPDQLLIRVDESLSFLNVRGLCERLEEELAARPRTRDLVLICSAVNHLDSTAVIALERLADDLAVAGVGFHLAELKGPVADRLRRLGASGSLAPERAFLSTHAAATSLRARPTPTPAPGRRATPAGEPR